MTGLGDRLKEARMAKGYTLDDLQAITKIQKRYLAGIENEEFGSMPGSFYVRAFIKQYAEAVGLDADEILLLYKDSSGAMEIEDERQQTSQILTRSGSSRRSSELNEIMPKIIVALFIIVIFGVIWFLWQHNASKQPEIDVVDDPIHVEDQPKPGDSISGGSEDDEGDVAEDVEEEPDPEPEQMLEHINVVGENSTYSLTNAEEFILEIRTSGDSWIGVLDSANVERTTGATVMKDGEAIELDVSDTDSVRIRVGRTASTEIYVNGELLEYASDRTTQNIIIEYKQE